MGLLFYQSALSHDYPVIMGILIIGSFLTLLGNMLADLALLKLNQIIVKKIKFKKEYILQIIKLLKS